MDNRVEIFEKTLIDQLFIKEFDLLQIGHIENYSDSLGENYKVLFKNVKRGVLIILGLATESNSIGDNLSLVITNEKQVDIDDEPYFLLTEWLDGYGREEERKKFYLNSYEGSFEEKLKSFFVYLNELFEDEKIAKVLRGETWMNFGFDWRGMK